MSGASLVRGRWVVTGARDPVVEDGAVAVDGGRVMEVGSFADLRARYPDADVLGGPDAAVMPGLINAHHHSHVPSGVQLGLPDDLLEPWILGWAAMRAGDRSLQTRVAAAMQLASGVTTVVDVMSGGGTAEAFAAEIEKGIGAYAAVGIRACYAAGFSTQSHLVSGAGEDERFIASLPERLRPAARSLMPAAPRLDEDDYLALMGEAVERYRDHPTLEVWYAPPGPQWVSDDFMQRIAAEAQARGTRVQTHVNESFYEKLHALRFYGRPTVVHLDALGVLNERFSIAHGVWLVEEEIERLAATGAAVCHNPSSNLRLRAGVAPLPALRVAGVTTALGMDGTTLDENEDFFTEMRLALRLNRSPQVADPVVSPRDVFEMATEGGAALVGAAGRLGRLAPGMAADLIVLDTARVTWPWVAPEADPIEVLLLRARSGDVRTVLVDGEVVFRDGRPTRIDLGAVGADLADALAGTPFPEARAAAVRSIRPHLERWYAEWDVPALEPWLVHGSRR